MNGKTHCDHKTNQGWDIEFLEILAHLDQKFFEKFNKHITLTSGVRCDECNTKAGGKPTSDHKVGKGADIAYEDSRQRYFIIFTAHELGINRFGWGNGFIHLGKNKDNPEEVFWDY